MLHLCLGGGFSINLSFVPWLMLCSHLVSTALGTHTLSFFLRGHFFVLLLCLVSLVLCSSSSGNACLTATVRDVTHCFGPGIFATHISKSCCWSGAQSGVVVHRPSKFKRVPFSGDILFWPRLLHGGLGSWQALHLHVGRQKVLSGNTQGSGTLGKCYPRPLAEVVKERGRHELAGGKAGYSLRIKKRTKKLCPGLMTSQFREVVGAERDPECDVHEMMHAQTDGLFHQR